MLRKFVITLTIALFAATTLAREIEFEPFTGPARARTEPRRTLSDQVLDPGVSYAIIAVQASGDDARLERLVLLPYASSNAVNPVGSRTLCWITAF